MELELPYPPATDHYWRRVGQRTVLSRGGRAYRRTVRAILTTQGVQPIAGRLAITIDAHPPGRRRRCDLDDVLKVLLDALQHCGVYSGDVQIVDLGIRCGACTPGGRVCVRLMPQPESEPIDTREPPEVLPGTSGGAKSRTCLKCGDLFFSTGPHHRICPPCSYGNDRLRLSEPQVQQQRGGKRHNGQAMLPDRLDWRAPSDEDQTC